MARTLINLPKSIRRGETIEIQTLIAHPMETGYRPGSDGVVLARDLIRHFKCFFDDESGQHLVFSAQLFSAISANPYLAFQLLATGNGTLTLVWEGDQGFRQTETVALKVLG
ncbi:MAG: thiosulfate oxidation carrier complex protein SoxZ [Burkholderiales bacterium]|nr:thiosulfate oxidation carrier complex protein SoxZ [Burkholderiales bacterium]